MQYIKNNIIFFILSFSLFNCKEIISELNRLTYKTIIDKDNSFYIINTENEYKIIKNLQKDEIIKYSGDYTYKWANQDSLTYFNLDSLLPKSDSKGYRDFSIYDSIFIKLYSSISTISTFMLVIYCQERQPDQISTMTKHYFRSTVTINFKGWKEILIKFSDLDIGYSPDITKVTGISIISTGWDQIPNPKSVIYFDQIYLIKYKYEFNIPENEINIENYSNIIKKLQYMLKNDFTDESNTYITNNRLKYLINLAKNTDKEMNKKGLPFNYTMTQTSHMTSIYYKLRSMAIGYSIKGGELNKNSTFLNDILIGLEYMHENYYNKRGNLTWSWNNWWDWEIGSAQYLIDILILINDDISQNLLNKYLEPINKYDYLPSYTMANKVDIAYCSIFAAVLQKDYKRIAFSIDSLKECFINVEKDDGFYDDGSYIQHSVYAYTGSYGTGFLSAITIISYCLSDTIFRLDDNMINEQYNWAINSYLPLLYNGAYCDHVRGRAIVRNIKGYRTGTSAINSLIYMTTYLINKDNVNYLKSILKYFYEINRDNDYSISFISLKLITNIENDTNILPKKINSFAKVFSRMDKTISQIKNISIAISMSSTRTGKYESINGENLKGWYTGDGMTYIYFNTNDYASDYWSYVNYYRIPGTTVTKAPREQKGLFGSNALAKYDFVGGCYYDVNLVAAMQFSSEVKSHNFISTLNGNKGYFIFEDILICIGNNISCQDNYDVETIIENKKLNGKFYIGNKEINNTNGNIDQNWIFIEGYGLIYIEDYKNAKYEITDKKFLELYILHGKNISNSVYSYMIFPNRKKENLNEIKNQIKILENNNIVTAVKNNNLNIIEYIFWKKGELNNIKVNNPCTLIITENYIYVSDPTQKLNFVTISIGNNSYQVRVNKGYKFKTFQKNN